MAGSSLTGRKRRDRGGTKGERSSGSPEESSLYGDPHDDEPKNVNGVRKCLLLLHDAMAIKFIPDDSPSRSLDRDRTRGAAQGRSCHFGSLYRAKSMGRNGISMATSGSTALPCHEGFYLFQKFCEVNLACYWNPSIRLTFQKLEYSGFIFPSTLLVSSLRKFLHVLRSAWTRQLVRSPPGFRIEFMGELEELTCERIQQSYFSPLSDSLCWAITDLSCRGEEAMLGTICAELEENFPWMVQPNPELVYNMLQRLIQENKVYKTSRGYFVVTPDTLRYMTHALRVNNRSDEEQQQNVGANYSTLPRTIGGTSGPQFARLTSHRNSVAGIISPGPGRDAEFCLDARTQSNTGGGSKFLTRHNSLKIFRRRDYHDGDTGELSGAKSFSFRMSRRKPLNADFSESSGSGGDSTSSQPKEGPSSGSLEPTYEQAARKKNGSFLRKLFSLRSLNRGKKKNPEPTTTTTAVKEPNKKRGKRFKEDLEGLEQLPPFDLRDSDEFLVPNEALLGAQSKAQRRGSDSDDFLSRATPRWNSLPKRSHRTSSRRSVMTMLEDPSSPLYATPSSVGTYGTNRPQSSHSSTLSHGTSLGYGSQGPQSFATNTTTGTSRESPCPSLSNASGTYAPLKKPDNSNRAAQSTLGTPKSGIYKAKDSLYGSFLGRRRCSSPIPVTNGWSEVAGSKPLYETIRDERGKRASIACVEKKALGNGGGGKSLANATITQSSKNNVSIELLMNGGGGKQLGGESDRSSINLSIGDTQICLPKLTNSSMAGGVTQIKTSLTDTGRVDTILDCGNGQDQQQVTIQLKSSSVSSSPADSVGGMEKFGEKLEPIPLTASS